jgi:hypothetical protein
MKFYGNSIAGFAASVLMLSGCASGSAIVTGERRPPVAPANVKIYAEPPAKYQIIGVISASSRSGWTKQTTTNRAIENLRRQAGNLGANGVLISDTSAVAGTAVGMEVEGRAIFVTD